MTYDELIVLYPWLDLFLELFKGFVPTIVAILAIVINNKAMSSRDKKVQNENKQRRMNETRIAVLNQMLDKYMELTIGFWNTGTYLILALSSEDMDEFEEKKKEFVNSLYQIQFKSQEIYNYFKSTIELYEFDIKCNATITDVNEFCNQLIDICAEYVETYKIIDSNNKQDLLDAATQRITDVTVDTNAWTHVIMYDISKTIKKLYEE